MDVNNTKVCNSYHIYCWFINIILHILRMCITYTRSNNIGLKYKTFIGVDKEPRNLFIVMSVFTSEN